jgi:uncharacterized damage-inducible protein DinB
MADLKHDLHTYLQSARDAMVWKLEGLSEYDQRRPLVPTGTNLLGLVKHLSGVEAGYFGLTFGRPFPGELSWIGDPELDPHFDLYASAEESADQILAGYRGMWSAADATIEALALDAPGAVPWWPEERRTVTLGRILVHVVAETNRHAGHADLVRELIDGSVGLRSGNSNLPDMDEGSWADHRRLLEDIAQQSQG